MISAIITAFKEHKTIGKAIKLIVSNGHCDEIIVVAPDKRTLSIAKKYGAKTIQDEGKGKPSALNLAVSKAKGDILILTDGDVFVGEKSLKFLLEPFKNKKIGAVSGFPVSLNSRKTKYGFWSYVLTKIADKKRLKGNMFCSGYLFAIRKILLPRLPENILSEDGYISQKVTEGGYKIEYSPTSKVYVKYPDNFKDWIKQKKRSTGGYNQIKKILNVEIRSFKKEAFGVSEVFRYVSGFWEFFWAVQLLFARLYLWVIIYIDINLRKKEFKDIWLRVDSTKQ